MRNIFEEGLGGFGSTSYCSFPKFLYVEAQRMKQPHETKIGFGGYGLRNLLGVG